ncbi:hypothetical protein [Marivirga sp.]|uniref:hypothetical protein n=1 Tax=Marivirga sp. TaxID=2018662 RepID=UPI002D7EBBD1|nr:hypothetical protein [Marivirga sp.]HET8859293.1 hypothetical protein [Marivirga sp.]
MIYLLILVSFFEPSNNIKVIVNEQELTESSTVFVRQNDRVDLMTKKQGRWVFYQPVFREYDNLKNGALTISEIEYQIKPLKSDLTDQISLKFSSGTYIIGISNSDTALSTFEPLHLTRKDIIQIVVREEDSYLGYLTELIGLPFVLPPKSLGVYGHQTDLRVGTDCAELAIYGARRMGFNIPYCGPRGILDYVELTDELKMGTIIHYGYQVSVLYEDHGIRGELDNEDLLIHAYQDRVSIEKLGDIELSKKEYKLYKWKE